MDRFGERVGPVGVERVEAASHEPRRMLGHRFALVLMLLLTASCTVLPEEADPTRWLDEDESSELTRIEAGEVKRGYPNLASVPDQAPEITTAAERRRLDQILVADRSQAVFSDQPLSPSVMQPEAGEEVSRRGAITELPSEPTPKVPAPERSLVLSTAAAQPSGDEAERSSARGQPLAVISFAADSSELDDADREVLRRLADRLSGTRDRLLILGHSAVGEGRGGAELSIARADAVAEGLLALGLEAGRLQSEGRIPEQTGEAQAEVYLLP